MAEEQRRSPLEPPPPPKNEHDDEDDDCYAAIGDSERPVSHRKSFANNDHCYAVRSGWRRAVRAEAEAEESVRIEKRTGAAAAAAVSDIRLRCRDSPSWFVDDCAAADWNC